MEKEYLEKAEALISFIESSPSPFHVVDNMKEKLIKDGFIELRENEHFNIERGKSYFVTRSSSSLIAFRVPEKPQFFNIVAAHTDSPCFKVKWNPVIKSKEMPSRLNTEGYGGLLAYTWFDRPLSLSGRVFYSEKDTLVEKHVDFKDELNLVIPSLAIHQRREANDGWKISYQKEMLPLFGDGEEDFLSLLAEKVKTEEENIKDWDLYLYNATPAVLSGRKNEYFSIGRIDDNECGFCALEALLNGKNRKAISMVSLFDNEETGSGTRQGALSDFLQSVIERISLSIGWNDEDKYIALSSSFMLSADNGHAVHPSYSDKSDVTNRSRMNEGILIKYAASQKYTTNGESGALTRLLLEKNDIPYQIFFNNSDLPGGSTLGNLSTQKISIRTSDVGCAQLAMHSSYETAGVRDVKYLYDFFKAFLSV